ncbi:Citrate transporter [Melioribacter roseus P3M-2]|uniref:Citrate transporter n=1 Tax=Melioribacter roseus (strain DSM 23840 / JCM 17771 / VKM B-2668 / P3M-2) TaxID=1191523 RepID=I6ZWD6_MELRP|nr:sodium:proton antiporter [Melioribacter roseus]AFN73378.1 Citrate transporter [Melioribacter roseus P3M-2]
MKKLVLLLAFLSKDIFASGGEAAHALPNPWMVIPFAVLLIMIATGPLFYHHFWEKNYPKIAIALGSITTFYYLVLLNDTHTLLHTAAEYISFIALLASLFVASGGILIKIDKKSTPLLNIFVLLFGSVIANIIGTTGASMLLIRPYIRINKNRIKPYHIIFFIFSVSNIGGALTPIGDPPLFLGFLRGVDFFWFVEHLWYLWLPTLIVLMAIFYVIDSRNKEPETDTDYTGKIEIKGTKNLIYLLVILISVFLDPGIFSWVPSLAPLPIGVREIIMFTVVYLSYKNADKEILEKNEFNFEPIREVAYLFIGIFATMIPALQLISYEAKVYGEQLNAGIFYWATGSLSAFLDNAPTFLNFLSAALGKYGMDVTIKEQVSEFAWLHPLYLQAISVAAVFFGAMTYIGNGPNFMVKSICERAGIKMPSFFGYLIKYSIPILLPLFTILWFIVYYGRG